MATYFVKKVTEIHYQLWRNNKLDGNFYGAEAKEDAEASARTWADHDRWCASNRD